MDKGQGWNVLLKWSWSSQGERRKNIIFVIFVDVVGLRLIRFLVYTYIRLSFHEEDLVTLSHIHLRVSNFTMSSSFHIFCDLKNGSADHNYYYKLHVNTFADTSTIIFSQTLLSSLDTCNNIQQCFSTTMFFKFKLSFIRIFHLTCTSREGIHFCFLL